MFNRRDAFKLAASCVVLKKLPQQKMFMGVPLVWKPDWKNWTLSYSDISEGGEKLLAEMETARAKYRMNQERQLEEGFWG